MESHVVATCDVSKRGNAVSSSNRVVQSDSHFRGGHSAAVSEFPRVAGRTIRANVLWTALGQATYTICQWLILVALIKMTSVATAGEFALAISITAPIFTLASLNLRSVIATDIRQENQLSSYVALRIITTLIALIITGLAIYLLDCPPVTATVVLVMAVSKAIESFSDICFGQMQRHERLDWVAQSVLAKGLLSLLAMAGLVYISGSLLLGLSGVCIAWISVFTVLDLMRCRQLALSQRQHPDSSRATERMLPRFEWLQLRRIFLTAFPLGFVMMLGSLNAHIPRYFIEQQAGKAELGIFAAISSVFVGLYFFQIAIGQVMLPRLARAFASRNVADFKRLAKIVLAIGAGNGILAIIVAVLGGSSLLTRIFSDEFTDAAPLFLVLAIGSALQCISGALAYFMHAARHFRQTAWATGSGTIVILVVSLVLIPESGTMGGAIAILIGAVVSAVVLMFQFVLLLGQIKES